MRLAIPDIFFNVELTEGGSYELIVENANMFGKIVGDLYSQINNRDGKIVLSLDDEEVSMAKYCEMVWNPFAVDFNNKKIVTALYREMQDISDTLYAERVNVVNGTIIDYLDDVISQMPYCIDYSCDLDKGALFKLFKVGISEEADTIVERIIDYIILLKKALGIEMIILVNAKQYLPPDDVVELYKSAQYEKIIILNIAGNETYSLSAEKRFLVDKDLCFVDLN